MQNAQAQGFIIASSQRRTHRFCSSQNQPYANEIIQQTAQQALALVSSAAFPVSPLRSVSEITRSTPNNFAEKRQRYCTTALTCGAAFLDSPLNRTAELGGRARSPSAKKG